MAVSCWGGHPQGEDGACSVDGRLLGAAKPHLPAHLQLPPRPRLCACTCCLVRVRRVCGGEQLASKRKKALEGWQAFTWASLRRTHKQRLLKVLIQFAPLLLVEDERCGTL